MLRRAMTVAAENIDGLLLAIIGLLLGIGIAVLYSASNESERHTQPRPLRYRLPAPLA